MSGTAVTIRAIAGGGDGVASLPDGRTVFVPRTAPGDTVTLRNVRLRSKMARADVDEIVAHSPDRATPPCPHYIRDRCGSCQVMHLAIGGQLAAKRRIAGDALRRIAKIEMDDPAIVPAPRPLGYRTKITLTVRGEALGYRRLHEPDSIFDVRTCLIAEPAVQELIDGMRTARRHLPRNATRVVLRRDRDGGRHVVVRGDGEEAWSGGRALHGALLRGGIAATVWWHPEGGAPRAVAGSDDPWPATVFEQVHPAMGDAVRQAAVDALGDVQGVHAWDLYAGIGETTAMLVARGASVESVERDRRAVELAERAGPSGPGRFAGAAEEMIGRLRKPSVIITNPPRTGMERVVVDAIAASGSRRVVYISCDPATLARDLARMSAAFEVRDVTAFDQFPQTAHLECVAVLEAR